MFAVATPLTAHAAAEQLAAGSEVTPPTWKQRFRETARISRGHLTWIVLWSVAAGAATVLSPALLRHPILLMALAPRALFVALAAPELDIASFVLLGTVRLGVTDPSYFLIGRRIAARGDVPRPEDSRFGLFGRLVTMMCRNRWLAALVLFLRPNARYLAVAGANRIPAPLAGLAAVTGTIAYLVALHAGVDFFV